MAGAPRAVRRGGTAAVAASPWGTAPEAAACPLGMMACWGAAAVLLLAQGAPGAPEAASVHLAVRAE